MSKKKTVFLKVRLQLCIGGPALVLAKISDRLFRTNKYRPMLQEKMLSKSFEQLCHIRKIQYEALSGQKLDYYHPQNYGQKQQQILLFGATPLKTRLADKYLAKDYIREKIGEEYVVPNYGMWNSFDEIDFDSLPDSFVLKTNHSCGTNYFVSDKAKMDKRRMKELFDKWMQFNYGATEKCEIHYRGIKPVILAEKYLKPRCGKLYDYKFACINGKFEFFSVNDEDEGDNDARAEKITLFDRNLNPLSSGRSVTSFDALDQSIALPNNIHQMIDLAEKLADGIDYVRVDFYHIDGHLYVGELTFSTGSFMTPVSLAKETPAFLSDEAKAFCLTGPANTNFEKIIKEK